MTEFIWGVLAKDDIRSNDLELTYDTETGKYSLFIETVYYFDNPKDEAEYLTSLLDKFTEWMIANDNPVGYKPEYVDIFDLEEQFYSITHAYMWFKYNVEQYVKTIM